MENILTQFLRLECSETVSEKLKRAAMDLLSGVSQGRRVFSFNLYDVTLDGDRGIALIDDVLDASPASSTSLPLSEFLEILSRHG